MDQSNFGAQPPIAPQPVLSTQPTGPLDEQPKKGIATTALILGIAAFVGAAFGPLNVVIVLAAIIFGIIALTKKQSKVLSFVGIALAIVGLIAGLLMGLFVYKPIIEAFLNPKSSQSTTEAPSTDMTTGITTLTQNYHGQKYQAYASRTPVEVGKDIPAGEYRILPIGDENKTQGVSASYFVSTKLNSAGSIDSADAIYSESAPGSSSFVTVTDGQFILLVNTVAAPIGKAPKFGLNDDVKQRTMLKVGFDFPAGNYTVVANDSSNTNQSDSPVAYVYKSSDATVASNSSNMVGSSDPSSDSYKDIALFDGEYITLDGIHLVALAGDYNVVNGIYLQYKK